MARDHHLLALAMLVKTTKRQTPRLKTWTTPTVPQQLSGYQKSIRGLEIITAYHVGYTGQKKQQQLDQQSWSKKL